MGRGLRGSVLAATLVASVGVIGSSPAHGDTNPYQRGPDPTAAYVQAAAGSYAVASKTIARGSAVGFGDGTIYYPSGTTGTTFGEVAVVPGFTSYQSAIQWLGPKLASYGFVVITIDTNTIFDQPDSRGLQLLAALDQVAKDPTVGKLVDSSRQAVVGHSMGGGGTLEASRDRPGLDAAVGLAPYDTTKSWSQITTPSLEIGGQDDTTAPPSQHALVFYNSMTNAKRRCYLELRGASHSGPRTNSPTVGEAVTVWISRYLDNDTRYEQFLTPGPSTTSGTVSKYLIS